MSRRIDYSQLTELCCAVCGQKKPVSEFGTYRDVSAPLTGWRYYSRCKECNKKQCRNYGMSTRPKRNARLRAWRRKNPEAAKANDIRGRLKNKYGLTPADVEAMKTKQRGKCLLCQKPRVLVIDHCHNTGRVRGLLCHRCNTSLGWIEAHHGLLSRIPTYLANEPESS